MRPRVRRVVRGVVAVMLGAFAATVASAANAASIEWPDTPAGGVARAYFAAYGGDEAGMRAFLSAHVSAADLAARPLEARVARWREMRGQFGGFTPVGVVGSTPHRVSVEVRTEQAGTLVAHVELHEAAPHTLRGIQLEVTGDAGGPGGPPRSYVGPPPTDDRIVAVLAHALDSLSRADRFSGTAVLDKDGRTLFAQAYGMASREAKRPNTLDTRYNIASIGKQFTAVAIRQLAAAGRLSLDDTVTKHLADYRVANAGRVTIAMLLEHRGGVPDVFRSEALWKDPGRLRTAGDWYALVREMPLDFEPGTRSRYSNGGYVLLGMIVERVSGEDYYAYLKRHVYEPAGMTRTASEKPDPDATDVATGYTRDSGDSHGPTGRRGDGTPRPAGEGFGRASAAGGTFASAPDLVRYARALREGRLLPAGGSEAMLGADVGLGVAGGAPGANGLLELQGPYTLVILANQDPPVAEAFAETVGHMIGHAARGAGAPEPRRQRVGGGRH